MGGYVSPGMGPRRAATIGDLILRRGDIEAQRALTSGDIWGRALAGLGQQIGGAIQQHQERKESGKRTEALLSLAQSPVWQEDPRQGFAQAVSILGPKDGPAFAKGLMATAEVAQQPDPAVAQKNLPVIAQGWLAGTPEVRKKLWSPLRQTMLSAQMGTEENWAQDWDEKMVPEVQALLSQFAPEEEEAPKPIKVGERLVSPTGEVVYEAPTEAAPTPEEEARAAALKRRAVLEVEKEFEPPEPAPGEAPEGSNWGTATTDAERKRIGSSRYALNKVPEMREFLEGNRDLIGFIEGRKTKYKQKFGIGASVEVGEKEAKLAVIRNAIVNALSGVAVNPQEFERIKEQIPNITDAEEVFEAKLNVLDEYFNTVLNEFDAPREIGSSAQKLPPMPGGAPRLDKRTQTIYDRLKEGY